MLARKFPDQQMVAKSLSAETFPPSVATERVLTSIRITRVQMDSLENGIINDSLSSTGTHLTIFCLQIILRLRFLRLCRERFNWVVCWTFGFAVGWHCSVLFFYLPNPNKSHWYSDVSLYRHTHTHTHSGGTAKINSSQDIRSCSFTRSFRDSCTALILSHSWHTQKIDQIMFEIIRSDPHPTAGPLSAEVVFDKQHQLFDRSISVHWNVHNGVVRMIYALVTSSKYEERKKNNNHNESWENNCSV